MGEQMVIDLLTPFTKVELKAKEAVIPKPKTSHAALLRSWNLNHLL